MEKWLEKYLKEKHMTRQILFLASEFESTRIDEERLKTLEKKIIPPEKIVVVNTIEDNMVEFDQVMAGWEDPTSEKENLDLMKTSVFTLFRSFDKEDLGMVSKEEFLDVSQAHPVGEDHRDRTHCRRSREHLRPLRAQQGRTAGLPQGEPNHSGHTAWSRVLPHSEDGTNTSVSKFGSEQLETPLQHGSASAQRRRHV